MDNLHRELDDVDKTNDAAVAAVVQTQIDVLETLLLEKPQP
jgi:hypothetical protein